MYLRVWFYDSLQIKMTFYAGNNETAAPPLSGTEQQPCQPQEQHVSHRGKSRYFSIVFTFSFLADHTNSRAIGTVYVCRL